MFRPVLKPLIGNTEVILTEVTYENRFHLLEDITHDEDHIHDFFELYINLSGDVSFFVEGKIYGISPGDIVISKPNDVHRCIYHSPCQHEHFCIWFKEFPFAEEILNNKFTDIKLVSLPKDKKDFLIKYCFNLYENFGKDDPLSVFPLLHSFYGILDLICAPRASDFSVQAQSLPGDFSNIVEYINKNFCNPACTISTLCDKFYISKSTLCRKFRNYFQTVPSDYIEAKRLSEAKRLLNSGYSVQSACLNCGFSDCSYFIMRFRKKFGTTPYKYQKSLG